MNFNPPSNIEPEDSQETAKQSGPPRVGQRRWLGRISLSGVALALQARRWRPAHGATMSRIVRWWPPGAEPRPGSAGRVAAVRPSAGTEIVTLPATTSAFSAANIFRARQWLHRQAQRSISATT